MVAPTLRNVRDHSVNIGRVRPTRPWFGPLLGELLKFVVNCGLPLGQFKQTITSLSRVGGTGFASVAFSVDLSRKEEDSQGFGITQT
jgi:hypothetical protein